MAIAFASTPRTTTGAELPQFPCAGFSAVSVSQRRGLPCLDLSELHGAVSLTILSLGVGSLKHQNFANLGVTELRGPEQRGFSSRGEFLREKGA